MSSQSEFLYQERLDNLVKVSMPLDIDDLEFLKRYADSLALSIQIIFSDGGWWLPNLDETKYLTRAVIDNRRNR